MLLFGEHFIAYSSLYGVVEICFWDAFKAEIVSLGLSCFPCTVYKQKSVHYWKPFFFLSFFFVENRIGGKKKFM